MDFNIKRLFVDNFFSLNKLYDKEIYITYFDDYTLNKFLTLLSQRIYNLKINSICTYDNFNTDYINGIILPDLKLLIKGSKNIESKYNIESIIKNNENKQYIKEDQVLKHIILSLKDEIYKRFISIYSILKNDINMYPLNKFKQEFIINIFKKSPYEDTNHNLELLISSGGINGFKTFSNNLPTYENNVFVINDSFSLFKDELFKEIINSLNKLKLHCELYKSPIDNSKVDHIKIPCFDTCIISNNILFNEKIPGIQIDLDEIIDTYNNKKVDMLKEELLNLKSEYLSLSNKLKIYRDTQTSLSDQYIIRERSYELIEDIIKNVIH